VVWTVGSAAATIAERDVVVDALSRRQTLTPLIAETNVLLPSLLHPIPTYFIVPLLAPTFYHFQFHPSL